MVRLHSKSDKRRLQRNNQTFLRGGGGGGGSGGDLLFRVLQNDTFDRLIKVDVPDMPKS